MQSRNILYFCVFFAFTTLVISSVVNARNVGFQGKIQLLRIKRAPQNPMSSTISGVTTRASTTSKPEPTVPYVDIETLDTTDETNTDDEVSFFWSIVLFGIHFRNNLPPEPRQASVGYT